MLVPMKLRLYRPDDAPALAEIFRRSVSELGPRHYAADQVVAWASDGPDANDMLARGSDGRVVLVAVDAADQPMAFGDLEADGHIDLLFVLPEVAGTGIAGTILEALETIARSQGQMRLYVEASEAAKGLFGRHGFRLLGRNDLTIVGVATHNYLMEKLLQRQGSSHARTPVSN
jgi:putative acetyltransferase